MSFIDIIRGNSPNFRNNDLISKSFGIEKAEKDISKLVKKTVMVTRNGRTFQQTVYVSPETGEKEETPVGGELSPEVKGMDIKKYSEKALLITGDTYVNIDTLKKIKSEIGVGNWNQSLKGWVFPIKFLETILGFIWSDLKNKGEDEKANAVQNQKNESLYPGDKTNIQGVEGNVTKGSSDENGTKYDVSLDDGTKLEGVDEKVMDIPPEKDDKKISDIINNVSPESRIKSEKQLYGLKHIENIHQYSLPEYMKMHGLSQDDIDKVINAFKNPKTKDEANKRASSGGVKKEYTKSSQIEGLTKRQLIGKLVFRHYQAVKKAIESGEEIKPEVLELYDDLKDQYGKKRQAMSEETKRKISEALKKNKIENNPLIQKEKKEVEKQGTKEIDKEDYKPKKEELIVKFRGSSIGERVIVKNYLDIPSIDISISKQKDILKTKKPYFIPNIDEFRFEKNGYRFSSYKISDDKYIVALGGYHRDEKTKRMYTVSGWTDIEVNNDFAYMTLDQLAATENYYVSKAKQIQKEKDDERVNNYIKKLITDHNYTEEDAKKTAKRRIQRSRISVMADNKSSYDNFHLYDDMYYTLNNKTLDRNGEWKIHRTVREDIKQKISDLSLQQEYSDSAYTKGAETSYGNSGTKNNLLNEYGVKVKRQNGDEINDKEIGQIKNALDSVGAAFGNNKQMNKEFGLKISHSGEVLMHARKAIGIFHPVYNAIGVSNQHGSKQFGITFAHEYGHFMDYWIGKKSNHHYASDKQGSTENIIADTLRRNLNVPTDSAYTTRTCECFARSMEMYYQAEILKDQSTFIDDDHCSKDVYDKQLKPLIQQFLQENKEILKSLELSILK